jgi:hypothetical protein
MIGILEISRVEKIIATYASAIFQDEVGKTWPVSKVAQPLLKMRDAMISAVFEDIDLVIMVE